MMREDEIDREILMCGFLLRQIFSVVNERTTGICIAKDKREMDNIYFLYITLDSDRMLGLV